MESGHFGSAFEKLENNKWGGIEFEAKPLKNKGIKRSLRCRNYDT